MNKLIAILALLASGSAFAATTNLAWDANTEADLAGYKIYRSTTPGGPYTLSQTLGRVTTCVETTTVDGTYYWVATAYDNAGNESGYSNQVSKTIDTVAPSAPRVLRIN
jgi:fibronectin type 3 domain-containing protein